MRPFFWSKRLSTHHNVKVFRTYIEPVLLYNSETWTLTATLEKSLDAFHRRLLRIALNVKYPKVISSQKLYSLTREIPISNKIKKRRLALFGHILRLDPETPAQRVIKYYVTPHKRPVGRPPLTWMALIIKDLRNTLKHNIIKTPLNTKSLQKLSEIVKDKTLWRQEIVRSMRSDPWKLLLSQSKGSSNRKPDRKYVTS